MRIANMSVELVDHMGSDLSVVNAARVSFSKTSEWEYEFDELLGTLSDNPHLAERDVKLIKYLAKHNHWSPFAHAFVSLRIKAPIFVARQLVKHQVGLAWNEVSRRYVDDEPEFWFPVIWRGKPENAKQGSSGEIENQAEWTELAHYHCGEALADYQAAIKFGMAPEQARIMLPQNTMTEWIWSGSLMAFARVCKLRLDAHAQQETQEVAQKVAALVEPLFPASFKALLDH